LAKLRRLPNDRQRPAGLQSNVAHSSLISRVSLPLLSPLSRFLAAVCEQSSLPGILVMDISISVCCGRHCENLPLMNPTIMLNFYFCIFAPHLCQVPLCLAGNIPCSTSTIRLGRRTD
jgi:hypothetical protein